MTTDTHLSTVAGWVGRSYADLPCWQLVREAYRLRGIELPADYYASLDSFRTVFEPEPWDLVVMCNHRLSIANHVGLYLGEGRLIHSVEDSNVVITPLEREPWWSRVARTRPTDEHPQGRRGYLRYHA